MMINKIIILIFCLTANSLFSQKIIEDFNNDKVNDTLIYKCYRVDVSKGINEPVCKCTITTGITKKKYAFSIPYVSDITISSCGAGCISLYDASKDTETIEEYFYNKKYNDWILREKNIYINNKKIKKLYKKYLISISGKKIKNESSH